MREKRCKSCKRKTLQNPVRRESAARVTTYTICSECGFENDVRVKEKNYNFYGIKED